MTKGGLMRMSKQPENNNSDNLQNLTDSLTGILSQRSEDDDPRAEVLKKKYEITN